MLVSLGALMPLSDRHRQPSLRELVADMSFRHDGGAGDTKRKLWKQSG